MPYPDVDWTRRSVSWQKVLKLRDPATGTFGYAIASDFIDPILFVYQHGGRLFDDLQNPTRTTFTDPKTIETVEWYAKLLQQEGAVLTPQVAESLGTGNLQNVLRAGKSAMWIGPLSACAAGSTVRRGRSNGAWRRCRATPRPQPWRLRRVTRSRPSARNRWPAGSLSRS